MPNRIRIMLADDQEIARTVLAAALAGEPDFEIVGQASNGIQAVTLAQRLKPDVVLMDVQMPQMDGIDATRLICSSLPRVRVVGVSVCHDPGNIQQFRRAGGAAYVSKESPIGTLIRAIRDVTVGRASRATENPRDRR